MVVLPKGLRFEKPVSFTPEVPERRALFHAAIQPLKYGVGQRLQIRLRRDLFHAQETLASLHIKAIDVHRDRHLHIEG